MIQKMDYHGMVVLIVAGDNVFVDCNVDAQKLIEMLDTVRGELNEAQCHRFCSQTEDGCVGNRH